MCIARLQTPIFEVKDLSTRGTYITYYLLEVVLDMFEIIQHPTI